MTERASLPIRPRALAKLRTALAESPLIVELRIGNSVEPERLVFYRYDLLVDYLQRIARPGDTITAWRFDVACTADNALLRASKVGSD